MQNEIETSIPLVWTIGISPTHISITEPTHRLVIHSKGTCVWKECKQDTNINSTCLDNRDINNSLTHMLVIHSKGNSEYGEYAK